MKKRKITAFSLMILPEFLIYTWFIYEIIEMNIIIILLYIPFVIYAILKKIYVNLKLLKVQKSSVIFLKRMVFHCLVTLVLTALIGFSFLYDYNPLFDFSIMSIIMFLCIFFVISNFINVIFSFINLKIVRYLTTN